MHSSRNKKNESPSFQSIMKAIKRRATNKLKYDAIQTAAITELVSYASCHSEGLPLTAVDDEGLQLIQAAAVHGASWQFFDQIFAFDPTHAKQYMNQVIPEATQHRYSNWNALAICVDNDFILHANVLVNNGAVFQFPEEEKTHLITQIENYNIYYSDVKEKLLALMNLRAGNDAEEKLVAPVSPAPTNSNAMSSSSAMPSAIPLASAISPVILPIPIISNARLSSRTVSPLTLPPIVSVPTILNATTNSGMANAVAPPAIIPSSPLAAFAPAIPSMTERTTALHSYFPSVMGFQGSYVPPSSPIPYPITTRFFSPYGMLPPPNQARPPQFLGQFNPITSLWPHRSHQHAPYFLPNILPVNSGISPQPSPTSTASLGSGYGRFYSPAPLPNASTNQGSIVEAPSLISNDQAPSPKKQKL